MCKYDLIYFPCGHSDPNVQPRYHYCKHSTPAQLGGNTQMRHSSDPKPCKDLAAVNYSVKWPPLCKACSQREQAGFYPQHRRSRDDNGSCSMM
jgi:hypothetical protein